MAEVGLRLLRALTSWQGLMGVRMPIIGRFCWFRKSRASSLHRA